MADFVPWPDLLAGNSDQTAAHLDSILSRIRTIVAQNESLSKKLRFAVKEKGGNDKARLAKLFQMKGIDHNTNLVLAENSEQWFRDPTSFWRRPATQVATGLQEPQAQSRMARRFLCVLLLDLKDMNCGATADQTADALNRLNASLYPREVIIDTVKDMIDAGSRYNNIGNALGMGAIFVLGTEIAETHWTKLLPKSGASFDEAMNHLKRIGLAHMASSHSLLRTSIISAKLHELVHFGQPRTTAPTLWHSQAIGAEPTTIAQGALDGANIDFTMSDYGDPDAISPCFFDA